MTCRTNPANLPTRQGHAVAANSPNNQVNTCSLPLFTSSLFHSFTAFCSLSTVHSLPSVFCRLLTAFVIHITVSKNSPIFGVQSNETNQHDRFFICMRRCLLWHFPCKTDPKQTLLR
jgi:hypothetical protein